MMLVDSLQNYDTHLRWKWWCHLVSTENEEELHAFAAKLRGSKPDAGAQLRPKSMRAAHYDLIPAKRALAVRLGAKEVDSRRLVKENYDGLDEAWVGRAGGDDSSISRRHLEARR